jgi:hypothetical protein
MKAIQEAMRDPEEAPYVGGLGAIKAAKLLKEAQRPFYSPESLKQAARLPVPERQGQQAPVPQGYRQQVPVPVPERRQAITDEGERILTAQAGGRAAIPQQIENVASKGRHGDTMLMHVNPDELRGLSSLLGPTTTNPDTGLPEAFAWWLPLIGAAIGGIGAAATGHDWKKGLLYGGLAGLGGAGALSLGGASTAAGGLGSTWGPFSGLFGGATGAAGTTVGGASAAPALFNANQIAAINAAQAAPIGLTQAAATGSQALSSVPHTMGMGWGSGATAMQPTTIAPQIAANIPSQVGPTFPDITSILRKEVTPSEYLKTDSSILKNRELKHAQHGADYGITGKAYQSPTEPTIPWWKKGVEWAKKHPVETGAGAALGLAGLASQPPQQFAELPTRKVSEFTFEDDVIEKDPRVPRTFTQEELEERMFTGLDPEDPSYFEGTSFAKEGGLVNLAIGGVPNVFAGHVQGVGDGMSDQIPFRVVPRTPEDIPKAPDMAVLSTDEYVFPADAVSMLGNGSSDAGAKILDNAVKSVRQASIGTPKQITEIDGAKVLGGALTT